MGWQFLSLSQKEDIDITTFDCQAFWLKQGFIEFKKYSNYDLVKYN